MYVLGIESTAHTIGIALLKDTNILANNFITFKPKLGQGFIPRDLANHHSAHFSSLLKKTLTENNLTIEDIDLIGFARGPGIGSALKIGAIGAKYLAYKYNIPIVGVNHSYAHLLIAEYLTKLKNPLFVYVSGGNTQIISIDYNKKAFIVHGETLDIGVGNFFDSLARELYVQGGPGLSKLAENGKYIDFPYALKGMNFTFTGLLSHAKKLIGKEKKEDIAYSAMHNAFAMITEAAERALMLTNKKRIVVTGGVAQNKMLKDMLSKMAKAHNIRFGYIENQYNRDNGAMIGLLSYFTYKQGKKTKLNTDQRFRIDLAQIINPWL